MAARRLLILPTGLCRLSAARVRRGGSESEEVAIPMPIFAIDTDDGWILFDTGCDPEVMVDPEGTWGRLAKAFRVEMGPEDHQLQRLRSAGVGAEDVRHVVVSHLHMDHAGGIRLFPESQIWVQKAELRFAMFPDRNAAAGFIRRDFDDPAIKYELLEGDGQIVDGVYAILTDGHTPGHQSLVVDLPSGRFVLTGDCAYERRQVDKAVPPPVAADEIAAARSLARIRALESRDRATVIISHDMDAWPTLRIAPGAEYA